MARLQKNRSRFLTDVGSAIAVARRAKGLTQVGLAEKLGMAPRNLQRVEAGGQNLTLHSLEKIAKALSASPSTLLGAVVAPASSPLPFVPAVGDNPPERVPVVDLKAAAGFLKEPRSVEVEGWALVQDAGKGAFIARVDGGSMEPLIPNGCYCLFRQPPSDLSGNPVLLVEVRGRGSPDDGGSYLLKRVHVTSTAQGKPALKLVSLAKGHPPVVLPFDPDRVRFVAAFDRVLSKKAKK